MLTEHMRMSLHNFLQLKLMLYRSTSISLIKLTKQLSGLQNAAPLLINCWTSQGVITMRCIKLSKYLSITSLLLLSTPVFSDPTPGIKSLIETPASAFDVFLHQLYIAANGPTFFGGADIKEQIKIYQLDYDYESNLIAMGFHISPDDKLMRGFKNSDIEGKKDILLRAAKDIATGLGVEKRDRIGRFGLIQLLKIRNGWGSADLNEAQIKEEIAERTVIEVVYASETKVIYQVRRTQSGRYEFSMDTKTIK